MPEPQIAVNIEGLTKAYGTRLVLRDVTCSIYEGETVALMGPNGAGKTTLLRCIASTVRPTSGTVRCFGMDMRNPRHRTLLGIAGHESRLYPDLTLHENLKFAAKMHGLCDAKQRADDWLQKFGLKHHADRLPGQISRGMQQRVSLARACIHQPRLLLLDEPFTGLDSQGRESLVGLLRRQQQRGVTLCFATHDASAAKLLADRIVQVEAGRLQSPGNCAESGHPFSSKAA